NTLRVTNPLEPVPTRLDPIGVDISVVDAEDGQPLDAFLGGATSANSQFHIAPVHPGQQFAVTANGYAPVRLTYSGEDTLRASLQPTLSGRVTDAASGKAIPRARIAIGDLVLNTDSDGGYQLEHRPANGRAVVLAPGYRRADLDLGHRGSLDVKLQ